MKKVFVLSPKAMPLFSIGIVLYKGEKYLEKMIESLLSQEYDNFELLLRDQSPQGEAYDFLENKGLLQDVRIKAEKGDNRWHSGGHNALIRQMNGEWYVCASNDMIYDKNFLKVLATKIEEKKADILVPKLLRWDFEHDTISDDIDSCGIQVFKNHHCIDRGQGEKDGDKFNTEEEIFGGSGALFCASQETLGRVATTDKNGEKQYFDEGIHYKNDIDLAYRFQWAGATTLFVPMSKAWHDRQVGNKGGNMGLVHKIVKEWRNKPKWVKQSSFYGHWRLLCKNFFGQGFSPFVQIKTYWYLFQSLGFITLTSPYLWGELIKLYRNRGDWQSKKQQIKKQKTAQEIETFFL